MTKLNQALLKILVCPVSKGKLYYDEETNELYSRIAQGELTREIRILNNVGIAGAIFQNKSGEGHDPAFRCGRAAGSGTALSPE